jgi:hypothetical protein
MWQSPVRLLEGYPTMAIWRTKAYEMFGFAAGAYSYTHGVVELFADLR